MRHRGKSQPSISRFFTPSKKSAVRHKESNNDSVAPNGNNHLNHTRLSNFALNNESSTPIADKDKNDTNMVEHHNKESSMNVETKGGTVQQIRNNLKRKAPENSSGSNKKAPGVKLTPLEKSIVEFKESNEDKMLIIQVGYKYKLFGEDALKASKILNIMYIRDDKDERFSYCTFPVFKLHINLNRLLAYGFKIGVIKQMESAIVRSVEKTSGSDIMRRELTAVYTKGTYMGEENVTSDGQTMLHEDEDFTQYITCLNEITLTKTALVAIKPSTGEIIYDEFDDNTRKSELDTRLTYLVPGEIMIISKNKEPSSESLRCVKASNENALIQLKEPREIDGNLDIFFDQLRNYSDDESASLKSFYSVNFSPHILACMTELAVYLSEFKLTSIFCIPTNIIPFSKSNNYMILSSQTLRNLEIYQNSTDPNTSKGSLCWLLDHTRTKFGQRQLRSWISRPLTSKELIDERLDAIEDLSSSFNHLVDSLKNQLDKIGKRLDLEKMVMKIHYSASNTSGTISRRDIYGLLDSFNEILMIIENFSESIDEVRNTFKSKLLIEIFEDLQKVLKSGIVAKFLRMINRNFIMNNNDPELQKTEFFDLDFHNWTEISNEKTEIQIIEGQLEEELENIKQLTGRPQLKFITNKNEPYLIEVRNSQVDKLPKEWKKINGTTTVSRFRTPEVEQFYKALQYHQQLLISNCDKAFHQYLVEVNQNYSKLNIIIKRLATFDCLLSLTATSVIGDNIKPTISDDQIIKVKKSRNPIIEHILSEKSYVANDIDINYDENRVLIITGPNMGGKSSYVKQVALTVIMSQIGCYLPCQSATVGIFDSIFIRMGARDDILNKESTFMTEMSECKYILDHMSKKSLVILDEIGRGTGTSDGIAIAYAILRYIIEHEVSPLTLFITHYPSLHILEDQYKGIVSNYHMGYLEVDREEQDIPDVVFLYNLKKGVVSNSYGLNVAKLAGIPPDIITNALEKSKNIRSFIEEKNDRTESDFLVKFFHNVLKYNRCDDDELENLYRNL